VIWIIDYVIWIIDTGRLNAISYTVVDNILQMCIKH